MSKIHNSTIYLLNIQTKGSAKNALLNDMRRYSKFLTISAASKLVEALSQIPTYPFDHPNLEMLRCIIDEGLISISKYEFPSKRAFAYAEELGLAFMKIEHQSYLALEREVADLEITSVADRIPDLETIAEENPDVGELVRADAQAEKMMESQLPMIHGFRWAEIDPIRRHYPIKTPEFEVDVVISGDGAAVGLSWLLTALYKESPLHTSLVMSLLLKEERNSVEGIILNEGHDPRSADLVEAYIPTPMPSQSLNDWDAAWFETAGLVRVNTLGPGDYKLMTFVNGRRINDYTIMREGMMDSILEFPKEEENDDPDMSLPEFLSLDPLPGWDIKRWAQATNPEQGRIMLIALPSELELSGQFTHDSVTADIMRNPVVFRMTLVGVDPKTGPKEFFNTVNTLSMIMQDTDRPI
jgi:hypothetical protein